MTVDRVTVVGEEVKAKEEKEEKKKRMFSLARSSSTSSSSSTTSSDDREYEVQDLRDRLKSSRGSRFQLIETELEELNYRKKFSRHVLDGIRGFSKDFIIHPEKNRYLITFYIYLYYYCYY